MKIKQYTRDERVELGQRLKILVMERGIRKCDVAAATGLRWVHVHRIAEAMTVPQAAVCTQLEEWLDQKESALDKRDKVRAKVARKEKALQ